MDALLGAVADGDIGSHFPDTEARWKGARSVDLLQAVAERLKAAGWRVANVDATVLAEAPRLAPHVPRMRASMAAAMGVAADQVSVKATTVEGMGALGRREGMAAMAVATVQRAEG
jgi:2-C-methyl-D-erythritol 2,4-cyclodiphosphate synthase